MTIEVLEKEIRNKFLKKYNKEKLENAQDFFILQVIGKYKNKSVKFSDLVGNEVPVLEIRAVTYNECFESLLKSI